MTNCRWSLKTSVFCDVFSVLLGEVPDFEALSYVWGQGAEVGVISCNDVILSVAKNLFQALQPSYRGTKMVCML